MVNRLFGEEAALRGIRTVVWTRSWYFAPSRWEQDGARSDEGFLSGFQATISDHAGHYLQIPLRLETAPGGSVTAAGCKAVPDRRRTAGARRVDSAADR